MTTGPDAEGRALRTRARWFDATRYRWRGPRDGDERAAHEGARFAVGGERAAGSDELAAGTDQPATRTDERSARTTDRPSGTAEGATEAPERLGESPDGERRSTTADVPFEYPLVPGLFRG